MPSKDMLGIIVRKLVTLPVSVLGIVYDLLEKLSDPEWVEATKRFLRKQDPWPEIQKTVTRILVFIKKVELPAIAVFFPAVKFRVTPKKDRQNADVAIGYISPDLQVLLDCTGIESVRGMATLRIDRIAVKSKFVPILGKLGEKSAMTFGRVWQMLEKQGHGENGNLLVDGRVNLFPIEDTDQVFDCCWLSNEQCWSFGVYPVLDSYEWDVDCRFISLMDAS